jgi:thiamine pyrophosphate-dependent acetolactate synthase large subunit-like protein
VIWDNGGYGEIRRNQEARHPGEYLGVDLLGPDLRLLAASYGISGVAVSSGARVWLKRSRLRWDGSATLIRVDAGRRCRIWRCMT